MGLQPVSGGDKFCIGPSSHFDVNDEAPVLFGALNRWVCRALCNYHRPAPLLGSVLLTHGKPRLTTFFRITYS